MKERVPKVLMLGWEFPPVINGGLGVACHDLSIAMSAHADVTMIIPQSSPEFKIDKLNLIGLNNIDVNKLNVRSEFEKKHGNKVHFIPADLDPYQSESYCSASLSAGVKMMDYYHRPFQIDSLYGGNVIEKVIHFSTLAARLAEDMEFDVIHCHDWMTMLDGMMIKEQSGKPLVIHVHSLEIDRGGENCTSGWVYDMEKRGMECADLLIPVSRFTGDIIEKYYGIPSHKISPVHNGISKVMPFKSKNKYEEKTVLFIGRLTRQKGPEFFLDIASKVLEHDQNIRFVMAGSGDQFTELLANSSYRHIGNRFHLTGFLNTSQLRYLLSIADVYCMPSVSEPFGLSALEAAQFEVPCVISKQSGVAEVLSGSLKFDFWDVHKAADNIINLIHNPTLAKKIVEDANVNLSNIGWNLSAQKVMDAYRNYSLCLN